MLNVTSSNILLTLPFDPILFNPGTEVPFVAEGHSPIFPMQRWQLPTRDVEPSRKRTEVSAQCGSWFHLSRTSPDYIEKKKYQVNVNLIIPLPKNPVRARILHFAGQWVQITCRFLDLRNYSAWLRTIISKFNTHVSRYKKNKTFKLKTAKNSQIISHDPARKRSRYGGSPNQRFYTRPFQVRQKNTKASDQSEYAKPTFDQQNLQNGLFHSLGPSDAIWC